MIQRYFYDRDHDNPLRHSARFWYASNGRLKAVSPDRCGGRLYLGFELEVDCFASEEAAEQASDVVDAVLGEYGFVCKSDGSLRRGFEIVSDPMTLGALMLIRPKIEAVLAELDRRGGKSHNSPNAGLHIHTSRVAYGNDDDAKFLAFGKVMELTERFQAEFSAIARRDFANEYYAMPTGYGHKVTDSSRAVRRKAKAILEGQGAWGVTPFDPDGTAPHAISLHDDRRYHVWNFQNKPTVECRAFKGTLKADTLFATFAFVDGLVRYATTHTTPEVHAVSFADLIAWIGNDDLTAYWATRRSQTYRYTPYAA